jgi:hypothetical protein
MDDKISIVLPTLWRVPGLIDRLKQLSDIEEISDIILIDNSDDPPNLDIKKLNHVKEYKNTFIYAAWNKGVRLSKSNKICVMGDDVFFDSSIFGKMLKHIDTDKGMIGLSTFYGNPIFDNGDTTQELRIENANGWRCDGFACIFFIHKQNWINIPEEFKIWYGDDWLFKKMTKPNYQIHNINVWGSTSMTINNPIFDDHKSRDKELYDRIKDAKEEPPMGNIYKVIINNRDRLSTTKKLVEDLIERDTKEIWIIDNDSTYPPLLDWYNNLPSQVKVFKYHNVGHLALFSTGLINEVQEDWCIYTDSDIQLNEKMPKNYQEIMLDYAKRLKCDKIALSIDVSDIPDHYHLKEQVIYNERFWWSNEVEPNVYKADTDTTFCLIKKVDQFSSFRLAGDFTCKHVPWYIDIDNLDEEEKYYIEHCSSDKLTQYTRQHKDKINKNE